MSDTPEWILRGPEPTNTKENGPRVTLNIAVGMPAAGLTAEHAEILAAELLEAARLARLLPSEEWFPGTEALGEP